MEDNVEKNTPGPAIGAFIVLAILIIGAIYVLINTLNTQSSPTLDTLQATSTVPTSTTTGQVN